MIILKKILHLEKKKVDVGGWGDAAEAYEILNTSIERYENSENKKKRTFTYTTVDANTDAQQKLIKGLGWIENQNTNNKTWNDELSSNVYVSKVKFN